MSYTKNSIIDPIKDGEGKITAQYSRTAE